MNCPHRVSTSRYCKYPTGLIHHTHTRTAAHARVHKHTQRTLRNGRISHRERCMRWWGEWDVSQLRALSWSIRRENMHCATRTGFDKYMRTDCTLLNRLPEADLNRASSLSTYWRNYKIFWVHPQKALRSSCFCIKSRPVYSAPPTTCLSSQLQSVIHLLPAPFTDTWVGADAQTCAHSFMHTHTRKHGTSFTLNLGCYSAASFLSSLVWLFFVSPCFPREPVVSSRSVHTLASRL